MGRRKKSRFTTFFELHLGYLLFKAWTLWVKRLSSESLVFYGEKIGSLAFLVLRKRKGIALNNLHLALGKERSKEEIDQICRESFKNIMRDMMENFRHLNLEDSYLKTHVAVQGREHLDQCLKEGKGVIALTAHFGNFPLMAVRLSAEGYPVSIVARDPENPKIARMVAAARDRVGIEFIPDKPRRTCVMRCLRALKRNRVLVLQIDQNAPVTESWVDFFGYLVPTFKGPVVLSFRTGAPVIPMFILRMSDRHQVVIHARYEPALSGSAQQDITQNIARLTKIVEAMIRKYPGQWWWIHRRFRKARDIQTGKRVQPIPKQ